MNQLIKTSIQVHFLLIVFCCDALAQGVFDELSDAYKRAGVLLPNDFDKALNAAITSGNSGDISQARFILGRVCDVRSAPAAGTFGMDLRDEEAFDIADLERSQRLTDALMSFPDPEYPSNTTEDYRCLHVERHRATKSLYRNFSGLRDLENSVDLGRADRKKLRATVSEEVWFGGSDDYGSPIPGLLQKVNASLRQATRDVYRIDELKRLHNSMCHQLLASLPPDAAVIDIIRYKKVNGKPQYAAFIILHEDLKPIEMTFSGPRRPNHVSSKSIQRIDLGPCEEIDPLILKWLQNIRRKRDGSRFAKLISQKCWLPIQQKLPKVGTLYFVPDGAFHSFPWGAVPDSTGEPLLVSYKVAEVPFIEYLSQAKRNGPIDMLATNTPLHRKNTIVLVGGVSKDLPFSSRVAEFFAKQDNKRTLVSLTGADATVDAVSAAMRDASIVHLSTHGSFAGNALKGQREKKLLVGNSPQHSLLYSALMLSEPHKTSTLQTSVLTPYLISDLDLSYLDLAVLAACETDIGESGDGEGGFALPRGFHLAGCRDVISSFWRVNDEATSIFMEAFYQHLIDGSTPIEALRTVQIDAYRGELKLPDTGGDRGGVLSTEARRTAKRRSEGGAEPMDSASLLLHHWAAFKLSGPGDRSLYNVQR